MRRLILASASPRRRDLAPKLGWDVVIHPCRIPEPALPPQSVAPRAWAAALAYFKARAVGEAQRNQVVLGADTIVAVDHRILGKPADEHEARAMLNIQAGRSSEVITGICLLRIGAAAARLISCDVTRVWMRDDPSERERYLVSGEWAGKAGAYGIQDMGDRLVEKVEGSLTNVVGLPLEKLARLLAQWTRVH